MCLLLTSVTVLFEELSGGYKYLLTPFLTVPKPYAKAQ